LFADDPRAPFSIHRFVEHGAAACGKHPGEWFGPSATARCIQYVSTTFPTNEFWRLTARRALANGQDGIGLAVHITGDGSDVYEDAVLQTAKSKTGTFRPTLILIGIRLGLDRITPVYWEALKSTLRMPQSVGIAG
jgi:cysteine protease ATG4